MEYTKKLKIINKLGFHLRAVANFVKISEKFSSEIKVSYDGITADGKSIMGLMTLAVTQGSEIEIAARGSDAKEAVAELAKLINNKFGEKE